MKFGSVKFYKTLIVVTYLLLLLIPLVLAIVFGVLYAKEREKTADLEAAYASLTNDFAAMTAAPAGAQPDLPPTGTAPVQSEASFEYQQLYPYLYASRPRRQLTAQNTCYLTFDDGPSAVTGQILDTLAEFGIKATFFVTGEASEENPDILRRAIAEGHTVGIHSYSHDYAEIYASVQAYLADFEKMYRTLQEITGKTPNIFRFPGGSINVYNQRVYSEIIAEMTRRGFVFFDWNAAGSDAVIGGISQSAVAGNVLQSASEQDRVIVLLHDRADNRSTAAALPSVIRGLQGQGYTFAALTNEVPPITYFMLE